MHGGALAMCLLPQIIYLHFYINSRFSGRMDTPMEIIIILFCGYCWKIAYSLDEVFGLLCVCVYMVMSGSLTAPGVVIATWQGRL